MQLRMFMSQFGVVECDILGENHALHMIDSKSADAQGNEEAE